MQERELQVIDRAPFVKAGEVIVRAGNKAQSIDVEHAMDRPFEVPTIIFKLAALAEGAVVDPQPSVLDRLVKVSVFDVGRNHPVGNSLALQPLDDAGTYQWTPAKPFQLRRGDTLQILVDGRESFDIAFNGARKRIDAIRVEATLEGALLTYEMSPMVKSATGM